MDCGDADAECIDRTVRAERDSFARTIDRDLRRACRSEADGRRLLGVVAREFVRRRAYQRLGFVRLRDYAGEQLGMSARALELAAWVATRLDTLPAIAAAYGRGELSWTHARLLCSVADPATEADWIARARAVSVATLTELVGSARAARGIADHGATLHDEDEDLLDGEPPLRFRMPCPARVRALWRCALELARRVAGEELVPWRAAEVIAAEGIAGRPAGSSVGDRALLACVRLARRLRRSAPDAEIPSAGASGAGRLSGDDVAVDDVAVDGVASEVAGDDGASSVTGGDDMPLDDAACAAIEPPSASTLAGDDAFALEARLAAAARVVRTVEPQIGRLLRVVVDQRLYQAFAFASLDAYVRERLGISPRKAWALLKVERAVGGTPQFAEAYEAGRLSWVRVTTLLPVIERQTAEAWIARAHAVTVRRLGDEVNAVLQARDLGGADVSLAPPPLDSVLTSALVGERCQNASLRAGTQIASLGTELQIRAHVFPAAAVTQDGTTSAALGVCDAEIQFTGPASVVGLFRDAIDVFARPGEPRWAAVERLLRDVIRDWQSLPAHHDPVFARGGWRCAVPACSGRRRLHDHHVVYRSRGGDNALDNRLPVCMGHHLQGIHTNVIRAWGTAPHGVHWELGLRADAPPFASFVGDRVCRGADLLATFETREARCPPKEARID